MTSNYLQVPDSHLNISLLTPLSLIQSVDSGKVKSFATPIPRNHFVTPLPKHHFITGTPTSSNSHSPNYNTFASLLSPQQQSYTFPQQQQQLQPQSSRLNIFSPNVSSPSQFQAESSAPIDYLYTMDETTNASKLSRLSLFCSDGDQNANQAMLSGRPKEVLPGIGSNVLAPYNFPLFLVGITDENYQAADTTVDNEQKEFNEFLNQQCQNLLTNYLGWSPLKPSVMADAVRHVRFEVHSLPPSMHKSAEQLDSRRLTRYRPVLSYFDEFQNDKTIIKQLVRVREPETLIGEPLLKYSLTEIILEMRCNAYKWNYLKRVYLDYIWNDLLVMKQQQHQAQAAGQENQGMASLEYSLYNLVHHVMCPEVDIMDVTYGMSFINQLEPTGSDGCYAIREPENDCIVLKELLYFCGSHEKIKRFMQQVDSTMPSYWKFSPLASKIFNQCLVDSLSGLSFKQRNLLLRSTLTKEAQPGNIEASLSCFQNPQKSNLQHGSKGLEEQNASAQSGEEWLIELPKDLLNFCEDLYFKHRSIYLALIEQIRTFAVIVLQIHPENPVARQMYSSCVRSNGTSNGTFEPSLQMPRMQQIPKSIYSYKDNAKMSSFLFAYLSPLPYDMFLQFTKPPETNGSSAIAIKQAEEQRIWMKKYDPRQTDTQDRIELNALAFLAYTIWCDLWNLLKDDSVFIKRFESNLNHILHWEPCISFIFTNCTEKELHLQDLIFFNVELNGGMYAESLKVANQNPNFPWMRSHSSSASINASSHMKRRIRIYITMVRRSNYSTFHQVFKYDNSQKQWNIDQTGLERFAAEIRMQFQIFVLYLDHYLQDESKLTILTMHLPSYYIPKEVQDKYKNQVAGTGGHAPHLRDIRGHFKVIDHPILNINPVYISRCLDECILKCGLRNRRFWSEYVLAIARFCITPVPKLIPFADRFWAGIETHLHKIPLDTNPVAVSQGYSSQPSMQQFSQSNYDNKNIKNNSMQVSQPLSMQNLNVSSVNNNVNHSIRLSAQNPDSTTATTTHPQHTVKTKRGWGKISTKNEPAGQTSQSIVDVVPLDALGSRTTDYSTATLNALVEPTYSARETRQSSRGRRAGSKPNKVPRSKTSLRSNHAEPQEQEEPQEQQALETAGLPFTTMLNLASQDHQHRVNSPTTAMKD